MLALSYYLLKVIICSGILLGYYWLALRNKIFHGYNRFYLLAAVVLSLLLPIIKINFWEHAVAEKPAVIKMLQAVSDSDIYLDTVIVSNTPQQWDAVQWAAMVYFIVALVFLIILFHTLFVIYRLLKKYPQQKIDNISFVNTDAKSTPFSFLNYIFWNHNIDTNSATGKQIFKHEVAHIQQKHTYDKLFINAVLVFFWCNPFFWLLRKELNMIHEFIADKKAVEDYDTAAFAAMILQATYPQHQFALTNNFFYSPIKRRLAMLVKNNNPKVSYWSRVLVLPVAVIVFAAFTFKTKKPITTAYNGEKITVVIDAGHGGNDMGASSLKGDLEKNVTLAIAKSIKELNTNPNIEIILTRENDIYLSPKERAEAAKNKKADLLISIHTSGSPKPNTKTGVEFYVSKDQYSNSRESKVLASILLAAFTSNYKLPVISQPKQRQGGIWILQANDFPSVLIETGVINNEADINYLNTEEAKNTIAQNVLSAISKYAGNLNHQQKDNLPASNIIPTDTIPKKETAIYLEGKKITSVKILKDGFVEFKLSDGKKHTYNQQEAFKKGLLPPPPPPPGSNLPNDNKLINGKIDGLFVVDDKLTEKEEAMALKPESIESINILKGETATTKYGTKGKNGVIEITTKKNLPDALYVVDGEIKDKEFVTSLNPENIQSIDVLKGESATALYGEKGKNGVIKIAIKKVEEIVVTGYPLKKAVTKTGEIYIGVLNKIFLPAEKDKYDVMVNISNGSINGTDDYYTVSAPSTAGLLRITVLKKGTNQILYNLNFKAIRIPDGTKEVPPAIKLDDYMQQEVIL